MRTRIAGTGSHLPATTVTTAELAARAGIPTETLRRRTGIDVCHVAASGESASDLGLAAAREALAAAGVTASEIDCIVFATHSPDYYVPGTGPILGAKLDIPGVPAIDVRAQCSGFLYGLSIADHFIRLGTYRRILLVASEVLSSGFDLASGNPATAEFSGDGASAAVLVPEPDDARGVLGTGLGSDGRFARSIMVERPGSAGPPLTAEDVAAGRHLYRIGGFEIVEEGYRRLSEALTEALERCDLRAGDVSLFIPNQGALQTTTMLLRRMSVPRVRVYGNLAEHGNPGSASTPLCLDEAIRCGRVAPGNIVVMLAFGSGFTWAWAVIRW